MRTPILLKLVVSFNFSKRIGKDNLREEAPPARRAGHLFGLSFDSPAAEAKLFWMD
jgi:hypothetical protein